MVSTPWGYEIEADDAGGIPALLSVGEFRTLTGGKLSATDEVAQAAVDAATAAARNWCGWHIGPVAACAWDGDAGGRMARIPCMCVRAVTAVTFGGRPMVDPADFEWRASGLLRFRRPLPDAWRALRVEFTAGAGAEDAKAAIAAVASNMLVATPGVSEEHAGQVGRTFNKTGEGVTGGVALLDRDRDILAAWKMPRGL